MAELTPLQRALLAVKDMSRRVKEAERAQREPIAVVGMSCRFPGANDPDAYWRMLLEGRDAVGEVPGSRWDNAEFYDPDPEAPGKIYTDRGGFLDVPIDGFDAPFFGIPPREVAGMDPQQRLVLELAWEALEDAGIAADALVGSQTGVFLGIATRDYADAQMSMDDPERIDPYFGTGTGFCVAAGRVSHLLGFHGPNVALDTACSSSLVTIAGAVDSLRAGRCDLALAGGVNLMLRPETMVYLCKVRALSARGRCATFDASADGYVRGEGGGMVALKRLSDAVEAGDRILAVVRGAAVNHDGHSSGLTVPNGTAQRELLRQALSISGVEAREVGFIETHGTGTELGDPIEARALAAVLGKQREAPLVLGAVKSNIGHLEAAAGIAGFIKLVLAVKHGTIPANLHLERPTEHIDWNDVPLKLPTERIDWSGPRVGGVSSFGFSGTNAHVVVGEAPDSAEPPADFAANEARRPVLCLSAQSDEALRALADDHASAFDGHGYAAATLARRARHERRLAVHGTVDEIREALETFARGERTPRATSGRASERPKIAFLFTGQGAQYAGMSRQLYAGEPRFAETLDACAAVLDPLLPRPLLEVLHGDDASALQQTGFTQPALYAVEVALAELLASWGIEPALVLGHSVGEYAAAAVAGLFSIEDGARLIAERGRLMQALPAGGAMAAILTDESRVAPRVAERADRVGIAALNGPENTVISGEAAAVEQIVAAFEAERVRCQRLEVSHAFHSPLMDPMLDAFAAAAAKIDFGELRRGLISNVTGERAERDAVAKGDYWREHVRKPVRFADAVRHAIDEGADVLVEVGPHPTLIGMARRVIDADVHWVPTLRKKKDDADQLAGAVAALFAAGVEVDPSYHGEGRPPFVALPTYPFQRSRHWFEPAERKLSHASEKGHPLLGRPLRSPAISAEIFESVIDASSPAYLQDHVIFGATIFPAAGYLEIAFAAARALGARFPLAIDDFAVEEALDLSAGPRRVQTVVEREGARAGFTIFSAPDAATDGSWSRHARGTLLLEGEASTLAVEPPSSDSIALDTYYAGLAEAGIAYGPEFRRLTALSRGAGTIAALADERYVAHPTVLDAALQVLGATTGSLDDDRIYLPVGAGRIRLQRPLDAEQRVAVARRETSDDALLTADLACRDDDGPTLTIEGFLAQRASAEALRRAATRRTDDWLYTLDWEPRETLPRTSLADGAWLVVGAGDATGAHLCEALAGDGRRVINLRPADGGPGDGDVLPRASIDDRLASVDALAGAILVWSGANEGSVAGASAALLNLAQALVARGGAPLWIVTRGAQPLERDASPDLAGAALWGMGRTIAAEHTELRPTLLDLDSSGSVADVGPIFSALALPPDEPRESQLAVRDERLHVARLARLHHEARGGAMPIPTGESFELDIAERGVLDKLRWRETKRTPPGPGQVEIRTTVTGLNFRDVLNALGMYPGDPGPLGGECTGRVVALGEGVERLAIGDEVICVSGNTFGRYVTAEAVATMPIPAGLAHREAASIPITFLTAYWALFVIGNVGEGSWVLVHAAAGGVGQAAVQLARAAGARVVGTASEGKRDAVRALGAEAVFDSRACDFEKPLAELTGGRGVDLVLNSLTGEFIPASLRSVAPGGHFVEIGKAELLSEDEARAINAEAGYTVFDLGMALLEQPQPFEKHFREMLRGFADGELEPLPTRSWPIERTVDAFRFMAQAKHVGKIVISQEHHVAAELADEPPLGADRSYLVTGGLGGLGLTLAEWLVEHGVRKLVLAGRSAPSPAAEQAIERMRATGAEVRSVAADVSTERGAASAIESARSLAPLGTIFHAAGVLRDRALAGQTTAELREVLAPKLDAARHLDRLSPEGTLVLFSSTSAVFGSPGQANYAAANAALDALAHARRARGGRALAIDWAGWAEVGMAADRAAAGGVTPIAPDAGLLTLGRLLREPVAQAVVLPIDWSVALAAHAEGAEPRLFERFVAERVGVAATTSARDLSGELRAALAEAPDSERPAVIERFVQERVAHVLGESDAAGLAGEARFSELGLDSLMAVELRNSMADVVGRPLPASLVYDYPSIEALSGFLAGEFEIGAEAAPQSEPVPVPRAREDDWDAVSAKLDELSGDEMADLLAEQLAALDDEGDA